MAIIDDSISLLTVGVFAKSVNLLDHPGVDSHGVFTKSKLELAPNISPGFQPRRTARGNKRQITDRCRGEVVD